jgi:hypothetical protein
MPGSQACPPSMFLHLSHPSTPPIQYAYFFLVLVRITTDNKFHSLLNIRLHQSKGKTKGSVYPLATVATGITEVVENEEEAMGTDGNDVIIGC